MNNANISGGMLTANNIDEHFNHDHQQSSAKTDRSLIERIKRITSVSEVLRMFGACAVIASLSLFMLEGWSEGNDINRYLKLLGQTGILTIAGLVLSFVIKEFKGARLFFGLGLVSAVTNFTILGALIYSIVPLDGLLGDYPAAMTWQVGSASQFTLISMGAVGLLTVLARFSYSIFARKIAAPLTIAFLGLNALLLLPVRGTLLVSVLTIVSLLVAVQVVSRLTANKELVITPETKFAFATLFLPTLIIIGRAISLYNVDEVLLLTLSSLAYYAFRMWSIRVNADAKGTSKAPILDTLQYGLGFVIAFTGIQLVPMFLYNLVPLLFSVIVLAFTADQISQNANRYTRSIMLNVSTTLLTLLNVIVAFDSSVLLVKVLALVACGAVFLFSNYAHARANSKFARVFSLIGAAVVLLLVIFKLLALINLSNWMTIGLAGMFLIIVGSCYERFGLKLPSFKSELSDTECASADV